MRSLKNQALKSSYISKPLGVTEVNKLKNCQNLKDFQFQYFAIELVKYSWYSKV